VGVEVGIPVADGLLLALSVVVIVSLGYALLKAERF
jgi:hypothetical protein